MGHGSNELGIATSHLNLGSLVTAAAEIIAPFHQNLHVSVAFRITET